MVIIYLVYKNYNYHTNQNKLESFIDLTPNPTPTIVSEFVKHPPQNTPSVDTKKDLIKIDDDNITGLDRLSDSHVSINDINVDNEYDVKNTINPMMTSTMTTLPPVVFNDNQVTPSPSINPLGRTIETALLPSGTPIPTLNSNGIPTSVPTNNFSMPFDTSKITSNYSGMDLNQGPFFGVTQQNFNLNSSGDL